MPYCPRCGNSAGESDAFCASCGNQLVDQPSKREGREGQKEDDSKWVRLLMWVAIVGGMIAIGVTTGKCY